MSHRASIDAQVRGFTFALSGGDEQSGGSFELPKRLVQETIDEAAALIPAPSLFNPAVVSAAQGGSFNEGFSLPGFINFDATNAQFITSQSVSITLGDGQICSIFGVRNGSNNSTCFLYDGTTLAGSTALFCVVLGNDSIGYEIKGATVGAFSTCDRLTLAGARSIGLKITGTFTDPVDIDGDEVLLNGADSVYIDYNPDDPLDECTVDISTVFTLGATVQTKAFNGTTAYIVRSGHLSVQGVVLIADTAVHVLDGAEMDLAQETVVGDIIVDSGGILNVFILDHEVGTITNNGEINGIINGVPFGTYQQKNEEQFVLNADDFTTQTPLGTDTPLQVLFGAAQFGASDPVELDASGNITINQADQYNLRIALEYGRTNAGSFSLLLFRILVNGAQVGDTLYAQLSTAQNAFPIEFTGPINLVVNDILTVEIIRDSAGFDDGSLFPLTPMLGSVNAAPSAVLSLSRNRLVQPV